MSAPLELSVAVCTRNRLNSVMRTLDSLAEQTWDGSWEVVVVDNGSDDGSPDAVDSRAADYPVPLRIASEDRVGIAHARNCALENIRGRALVYVDDDITCEPGWLSAHGAAFRDASVIGTGGPIQPVLPDDTPEWFRRILPWEVGGPTSRYEFGDSPAEITAGGPIPTPFGCNMGVVAAEAREVGGFRASLGWGKRSIPSEEPDMFNRLRSRAGQIRYLPDARVFHHVQPGKTSRAYWRRWQRAYGRSMALMYPPQGLLGWCRDVARCSLYVARLKRAARRARFAADFRRETDVSRDRERNWGRLLQLLNL